MNLKLITTALAIITALSGAWLWVGGISARVDNVEKEQSLISLTIKDTATDIKKDINRVDDKVDKIKDMLIEDRGRQ